MRIRSQDDGTRQNFPVLHHDLMADALHDINQVNAMLMREVTQQDMVVADIDVRARCLVIQRHQVL